MERAYSMLNIKSFDDEQRVIRGVATSPTVDRMGDIVEPLGIAYAESIPLLFQHQHDKPVGTVRFDKPTAKGVTFEAKLPVINEPGTLKDRVDEAWQSVKAGLVAAVSIGFRALDGEVERLKGGGLRFLKTEVIELSLVTIPANSDAVITAIKSIDQEHLPAIGRTATDESTPGDSGIQKAAPRGSVKLIPRGKK